MNRKLIIIAFFAGSIIILGYIINIYSPKKIVRSYESKIELTASDIACAFEDFGLHIIPQAESISDYPRLNNIRAIGYELLDGTVYIYEYKNNEELKKGLNGIRDVHSLKFRIYIYEINNILLVYTPGSTPLDLAKEFDDNIQKIITNLLNHPEEHFLY